MMRNIGISQNADPAFAKYHVAGIYGAHSLEEDGSVMTLQVGTDIRGERSGVAFLPPMHNSYWT